MKSLSLLCNINCIACVKLCVGFMKCTCLYCTVLSLCSSAVVQCGHDGDGVLFMELYQHLSSNQVSCFNVA